MCFYRLPERGAYNMLQRITGLLLQEWFITKRSLEVIFDTVWFSVLSVIVFGFIAQYLNASANTQAATVLLTGMIWWEFLRINQYSLSLNPLWNIWSRNFANMFITPISKTEYVFAQCISAFIKSTAVLFLNTLVIQFFFNIPIFSLYTLEHVIIFTVLFSLFAWSVGLMVMGVIFRFGTRIQALAWGFIFLLQPLVAVFFPVSIMHPALQFVALLFPATHLFELNRMLIAGQNYPNSFIVYAFALTLVYLGIAIYIFNRFFIASQISGQFAKNDEG